MRKKYVSPLFAELELENILFDSSDDLEVENPDFGEGDIGGDDFNFDF